MNTISWRTPTSPSPMETNPRNVFERLFGTGDTAAERREHLATERSILDSIRQEAAEIQRAVGPQDRTRLSDYLDNLREIERRIQHSEARKDSPDALIDAPSGTPDNFEEHIGLMYDLLAAAFQANVSRVFTFMLSREISQRTYSQIGVGEQHHSVSHHQNKPEKMAQVVKINAYHSQLFARFLEKLRSIQDGDGSLLDHSLIVYGAGMGDSNGHATDPLPVAMLSGSLKGHRTVELARRTPVGNLWRAVAERFGAPVDQFGDSTGIVDGIF